MAWVALFTIQFWIPSSIDFTLIRFLATQSHQIGHTLFAWMGHPFDMVAGPAVQLALPIIVIRIFQRLGARFGIGVALAWIAANVIWFTTFAAYPHDGVNYTPYEVFAAGQCTCEIIYAPFQEAGYGEGTLFVMRVAGTCALVGILYVLSMQLYYMATFAEHRRRDRRRPEVIPIEDEFDSNR